MKICLKIIVYGMMISTAFSQVTTKQEYNAKSKDFLIQVKTALTTLSQTVPLLNGIQDVKINGVEGKDAALFVDQGFIFKKNIRVEKRSPGPDGSVAATNEVETVEPNGIILRIGVSDHMPKIETTTVIRLTPGHHNPIKLYFLIKTYNSGPENELIKKAIEPLAESFAKSLEQ